MQICVKYEYVYCSYYSDDYYDYDYDYANGNDYDYSDIEIHILTEENLADKIVDLVQHKYDDIQILDGCHSEEICKLVVQPDGNALSFVEINQTEELCKLSVRQNGISLKFVNWLFNKIIIHCIMSQNI